MSLFTILLAFCLCQTIATTVVRFDKAANKCVNATDRSPTAAAGVFDSKLCGVLCALSKLCAGYQFERHSSVCYLGSDCDIENKWEQRDGDQCDTMVLSARTGCGNSPTTTASTDTSATPATTSTTSTTASTTTTISLVTVTPQVFSPPTDGSTRYGISQNFTPPSAGCYQIAAWGAKGGTSTNGGGVPGRGAFLSAFFQLTTQKLTVIAGKPGESVSNFGGGGGGGSFVYYTSPYSLLMAAGGGGGSGTASSGNGAHGTTSQTASASTNSGSAGSGGGGGSGQGGSNGGGGGAGWNADGSDSTGGHSGTGGNSKDDWSGGNTGGSGGYGGGGGGANTGSTHECGGGGGGGFSGGGGGKGGTSSGDGTGGGGGGSFVNSTIARRINGTDGGNFDSYGKVNIQQVDQSNCN